MTSSVCNATCARARARVWKAGPPQPRTSGKKVCSTWLSLCLSVVSLSVCLEKEIVSVPFFYLSHRRAVWHLGRPLLDTSCSRATSGYLLATTHPVVSEDNEQDNPQARKSADHRIEVITREQQQYDDEKNEKKKYHHPPIMRAEHNQRAGLVASFHVLVGKIAKGNTRERALAVSWVKRVLYGLQNALCRPQLTVVLTGDAKVPVEAQGRQTLQLHQLGGNPP